MIKKIVTIATLLVSMASIASIPVKTWDMLRERQASLVQLLANVYYPYIYSSHYMPKNKQLEMNGVPVYNQGVYGTCTTFAVTAALEAKTNQEISKYCLLQLNHYLIENSYSYDWWYGAYASDILGAIQLYGAVPYTKEKLCGKIGKYDGTISSVDLEILDSVSPYTDSISLEKYHSLSKKVNFSFSAIDTTTPAKSLFLVKSYLNKSNRVLIGFVVTTTYPTSSYKEIGDAWTLTSGDIRTLLYNLDDLGLHEVVITGYDDDAVATDNQGNKHKGLLKVRNSWGSDSGDHGDYYMSYDYFKSFVIDLQVVL